MPFLWLAVDDNPGKESLRSVIETNSIALLSNFDKPSLDPPSKGWLGLYQSGTEIPSAGLWNVRDVKASYDPSFLDLMEKLIQAGSAR